MEERTWVIKWEIKQVSLWQFRKSDLTSVSTGGLSYVFFFIIYCLFDRNYGQYIYCTVQRQLQANFHQSSMGKAKLIMQISRLSNQPAEIILLKNVKQRVSQCWQKHSKVDQIICNQWISILKENNNHEKSCVLNSHEGWN